MKTGITYPEVGSIWRHYKAEFSQYRVVAIARHTETGVDLVIYEDNCLAGETFARPVTMWEDPIQTSAYGTIPRFTRL